MKNIQTQNPLNKNAQEELLNVLSEFAPIGKNGEPKSITKPFPKEITSLLSSQKTKLPEMKEITLQELFNINPIGIQREIKKRLLKNRKYLSDNTAYCMETGRMFQASRLPNGKLDLIDGNTRVGNYYNELERCVEESVPPRFDIPATVTLLIHEQDSVEDAHMLYLTLDNSKASENSKEKVSGAKDLLDIEFKQPYLEKISINGLKDISKKIPGCNIEEIPNPEYGIMKEFLPELKLMDKQTKFDNRVDGMTIAVIVGLLRKFRCSTKTQNEIIDFANKILSPTSDGVIQMPNGERNAVAYIRDEYFQSPSARRFKHHSSTKMALVGFWVHYWGESTDDKMLPSATRKTDEQLKTIGNNFFRS